MSYAYHSHGAPTARRYQRSRPTQNRNNRGRSAQSIDPRRFIAAAAPQTAEPYTPKHSFGDFALHPLLQANLATKGYTAPSPIQDQAIPAGLMGKDVIGLAGTGTGKTAAFALPLLQRLVTDHKAAALIIAPTRELAQQITVECLALAKGINLHGALLIGGASMGAQLRDLRARPRLVIGTPGRIQDHLQRGTLNLASFNIVVLDEVDRMLDMGFVNEVKKILSQLHNERQSYFFSATMDAKVRTLIESFTDDPVTVTIQTSRPSENVHQDVIRYQGDNDKLEKLHDLLLKGEVAKAIVFDETQRRVERLSKELADRGFSCTAIHGGKSQGQRQRALSRFKQDEVSILVATDVAARGIDVANVSHVINYAMPKEYDDYIHRIGRAGRAGQVGYALTFVAH